ncbi:MAG: MBL fold metallo-hydrolase [Clostridiales bacterium]|nr:MBL fold metallo-hydrolase [Clostridiales bacterium]
MKLTILGANGPYPGADGACSGYLVEGGGAALMLDAGSGALARLMGRLPLTELDAAVLSHLHYDHMSDMLPMLYALGFSGRSQPLRTIAPHTPEAARALLNHPALAVEEPTETAVKGLKLTFAPARHPIEAYMISVEGDGRRLAFTGDTNTCDGLYAFAAGADLLLADAGLLHRDWTEQSPHLSAALCGELAAKAGARRLVLTHLSPRYDPADVLAEARAAFPAAQLARAGETIEV